MNKLAQEQIHKDYREIPVADCLEETDARLIAAAPEMYELLKVWVQVQAQPTLMEARDTARKLLARIDGEETQNE